MTDVLAPNSLPGLQDSLSVADYHRLARSLSTEPAMGLTPLRLGVVSSYTASLLKPFLVVEAARRDFAAQLHFGGFNQFEQELVDDASAMWEFSPDVVLIAMRPEDIDSDAVERYHASDGKRFEELADSMCERISRCILAARGRMSGPIFVANVAMPAVAPLGPFDASRPNTLTHAVAQLNRRFAEVVGGIPGSFVWDYAGLVRSRGAERWTDPRTWSMARAPVGQEHQPALASHLMRTIAGALRTPAKCLVLDLDNTLWGGVIGDDGPSGIKLGDDYPGNCYKQLQRAALALMDRGILLAIASKNNPDVVEQTLRTHPEMILRWDDFACVKANWRSKSENLREIAAELNIGIDALVLFDDNPVERAEVQSALPTVGIVDVPVEPVAYAAALQQCEFFDQPALQAEDRDRAAMYRKDRERRALAAQATTPTEFLASLEMEAEVGRADDQTTGRIVQLIGKTNQFNLTTRRHSQADVVAMAHARDHVVAWLRLRDRFGDQGLVVVGIVRKVGTVAEIDTFLMSCRVMNRRVEQAFMSYLLEQARAMGCHSAAGEYLPTAKNSMVAEFYSELGFASDGETGDGGRRFVLDLTSPVAWPDVIRRRDAGT